VKLLERLLWIIGVALIAAYCTHLLASENARGSDVAAFKASIAEPEQSLWSEKRIEAYNASLAESVSDVLGILEIPRLDLEVAVYDGASDLHMDRGAARIDGTAMPGERGNLGVAGHRDGYLRVLKDIALGDEIRVTSSSGPVTYVVSELSIVSPTAVEVLDPTETPVVTLVTCYPFYFVGHAPERFIVRAIARSDDTGAQN
jgi:sortase A